MSRIIQTAITRSPVAATVICIIQYYASQRSLPGEIPDCTGIRVVCTCGLMGFGDGGGQTGAELCQVYLSMCS